MPKKMLKDGFRHGLSAPANALIDGHFAGRIDRRTFLRQGAVFGLSASALGVLGVRADAQDAPVAVKKGGILRVGVSGPTGPADPMVAANQGSIAMYQPVGEYLIRAEPDLSLRPFLATEWSANDEGTVWTFKLRQDVTFQDGQPMTAADVVATFNRLADPQGGSIALSAFRGIINDRSATVIDDHTVQFELERPVGNFPYLTSSDTYSAIILPASFAGGFEEAGFPGTGPLKLQSYSPTTGATFVRHEGYWDKENPAPLDQVDFVFFADETPALLALQGGEIDVVYQMSVQNGRAVLNNPAYNVVGTRSAASRPLHLRTDTGPWADKRVRQAFAYTVDRNAVVQGLMQGYAEIGNDSPFAPVYPVSNTDLPQREVDLDKARALLAEAGVPDGFTTTLNVLNQLEIPAYAVILQAGAAKAGINLEIILQDGGTYYGDGQFGSSPWLDSTAGITDFGHRSIPNVYLTAQFQSDGVWNSSHLDDPELDAEIGEFLATVDFEEQRRLATAMQERFLDLTPTIYAAFLQFIFVSTSNVAGIVPNSSGQLFLGRAGFVE